MSDPSHADLYLLESSILPPDARVAAFTATEALSQPYRISVGIVTEGGEIDLAEARGMAASLHVRTGSDPPFAFHGMIAEASLRHAWSGHALFELVIVPRVWVMTLTHYCRVFVDKTVPEIIETLLDDSGFGSDAYELRLDGDYQPHFHTCQYKESRWAFLSRLMEREGLYYYFEHGESAEKLIITDHRSFHEPLRQSPARYVPLSGEDDAMSVEALRLFTSQSRCIPQKVKLRDFDYLKPTLDVSTESTMWEEAAASQVHLGEHDFRTAEGGKPKATALADAFKATELTYRGRGRVFGLRAGYRFEVDEHPLESVNREYLAVTLRHEGVQAAESPLVRELLGVATQDDYRVEVEAVDAAVQWRAPARTPVPRISSVERAFVDGPADSDYAQIDDHGRYKVKLHFDIDDSDIWDGEASTWIRMLQPHGGTTEGFHFPLRKNTEVLILFLGGDPDRPVIAGAVPNATQPSPVTSKNHTQNVVQTGGASRIEIEDNDGKRYVDISTPPENTFIHLGIPHTDTPRHTHTIVFNTDGNQLINIGGNRDIEVGGPQNAHIVGAVDETYDAGQTTDVTGNRVLDVSGKTTIDTGTYLVDTTSAMHDCGDFTLDAGPTMLDCKKFTLDSGVTMFDCADVTFDFGKLTLDVGPTGGSIKTLDLDIPGGATIKTPSWKVTNPQESWLGAIADAKWGKQAQFTGLTVAATGVAISAAGMKVDSFGAALTVKGFFKDTKGVDLNSTGPNLKTSAVKAWGSGLTTFA